MPELKNPIRQAYNRCKVEEPLEVGDDRYVDVDSLRVRGDDKSCNDFLLARILTSDTATHQIYSGFRGSGKSTELKRLARSLEGAGHSVIFVDTEDYLNLRVPARVEDLLITIAAGMDRFLGGSAPNAAVPFQGFWSRLFEFAKSRISVENMKLTAIPGVAEFELGFKKDVNFKKRLYDALESRAPEMVRLCHDFVDEAVSLLAKRKPDSPGAVIILDSFEKLRGTDPKSAEEVRQSVETVFIRDRKHLDLPCHAIFTVPPWLAFMEAGAEAGAGTQGGRLHILPMCKVFDPVQKEPHEAGIQAMMEILRRRIPLNELFADPNLLRPLAEASGGYPRDLLRMAREILLRAIMDGASLPIPVATTQKFLDRVLGDFTESYENSLVDEDLDLLAEVGESRSVVNHTRTQLQRLAELFDHHFVLSYRNGGMWFDLHPLVRRTRKMSRLLRDRDAQRRKVVPGA
ncbi:MAG: hypothetical protein HYZ53_17900 [Planctomycetes bacterium]|nr:hypothetical protein [Planctomycetota bacterium]